MLAGCSGPSDDAAAPAADSQAQSTTSADQSEGKNGNAGKLGERFEMSKMPDNDIFVTVQDIKLGGECANGGANPGEEVDDLEGKQYLQLWAEIDVERLDNPGPFPYGSLLFPDYVDAEGFTSTSEPAFDCQEVDGHEPWGDPVYPGNKSRMYGAFIVPEGITEVHVEGRSFKVEG
ncbi:hypothetical protein [Corynebacterium uterequi]|uniref:Uncharacterized protein n=1 Tax=Corynebacterium uterequi TaxID=1072256 RepID=A0A0G3HDR4_9CORY|nr:hypothetical protein [Corynebacterium uterequi]AKK10850.1 hypothetical protein CUTER_04220 [Corynebacterium uterequi]